MRMSHTYLYNAIIKLRHDIHNEDIAIVSAAATNVLLTERSGCPQNIVSLNVIKYTKNRS